MAEPVRIVQADRGSGPLYSKKKKRKALLGGIITLCALVGLGVFLYSTTKEGLYTASGISKAVVKRGNLTTYTDSSGTVILPTQVSIVNSKEVYVEDLLVEVGDSINRQTVLARLSSEDLDDERTDLVNNLETAYLNLEQIEADGAFALRSLHTSLERIEEDIAEAASDVEEAEKLKELKSSRTSDWEAAVDAYDLLVQQRDDLLFDREKQISQNDLSVKKQKVLIEQYKLSLKRTNEDIADLHIRSPIDGEILEINDQLEIKGAFLELSTQLFTVADRSDLYVDMEVYEQYSSLLNVGDTVELLTGGTSMAGEITRIGKVANLSSDGLAATVTVRVKPLTDQDLTPGASVTAEFLLGTNENALLLPRGAFLTSGGQKYVYKIDGGKAYKTEVVFGEIQGTQVEILEGLKAGEQVIISSYQSYIDQEVIALP